MPKSPRRTTRYAVYRRARARCFYCSRPISFRDMTLDHYIPRSLGGANGARNLVASCRDCNQRKAGQHPLDYFQHYDPHGNEWIADRKRKAVR